MTRRGVGLALAGVLVGGLLALPVLLAGPLDGGGGPFGGGGGGGTGSTGPTGATGATGATGLISSTTITLDRAALVALSPTAPQVVAMPASGQGIVLIAEVAQYIPGTQPYDTFAGGQVTTGYGNPAVTGVNAASIVGTTLLDGLTASISGGAVPSGQLNISGLTSFAPSAVKNQPLVLYIAAGHTLNIGTVATASVAAGGSGWAVNDEFTIANYGNADAIGHVTGVSGGAVTTFTIAAPGTEYGTDANPIGCTANLPSLGTGLTVNVNTINSTQLGDGTLVVTVYYVTVPVT